MIFDCKTSLNVAFMRKVLIFLKFLWEVKSHAYICTPNKGV